MDSKQHARKTFIFAAILFALTLGFGCAAILVGANSFQNQLGALWIEMVPASRAGAAPTLAYPEPAQYALACRVICITLRTLSQPLGAIPETSMPRGIFPAALAGSGVIELLSTALIPTILAGSFRRARSLGSDTPIRRVVPFLGSDDASFSVPFVQLPLLSRTVLSFP